VLNSESSAQPFASGRGARKTKGVKLPVFNEAKVLIVLEVSRDNREASQFVRVVLAIPCKQGKVSRVWATPAGYLSSSQLEDVCAWIGQNVSEAVTTPAGYLRTPQELPND